MNIVDLHQKLNHREMVKFFNLLAKLYIFTALVFRLGVNYPRYSFNYAYDKDG